MDNKDKIIIAKLANIVAKQQQIINKLAQATNRDPVIDYITHGLVPVVAANLGLPNVVTTVEPSVSNGQNRYTANIAKVPLNKRESFLSHMNTQVQKQKPELASNITTVFID